MKFAEKSFAEKAMEFIKKVIHKTKQYKIKGYTLKFMEGEKKWYVLKGQNILFIGDEPTCRTYLNTL